MKCLIITESCSFSHIVKPLLFIEDMKKVYPRAEFIVCCAEKYASFFQGLKVVPIKTLDVQPMYSRMANDEPLFTYESAMDSFKRDKALIDEYLPDVVAFDLAFGAGLYAKKNGMKSVALITGSQHPFSYKSNSPPNSVVKSHPRFFKTFLPICAFISPFIRWIWFRRDSLPIRKACAEMDYPKLSILEYMSYADMRYVFDSKEMILMPEEKDVFYGFADWDSKEEFSLEVKSFVESSKKSKLIYFSLGTAPLLALNEFIEVVSKTILALARRGYYVLVVGNINLEKHERILQVPFVNQHLILNEASAFVHYGGCLSLFSGFLNKVPQVVFPFIYDQHVYAEFYQKRGLLKYAYASLASVDSLTLLIEDALHNEAYHKRVSSFECMEHTLESKKIRELLQK